MVRVTFALVFLSVSLLAQDNTDFLHQTDVVNKMKKNFSLIDTYTARFKLVMKEEKKTKLYRGKVYYERGGKIHYDFQSPSRDKIISDGKTMWVYIQRLNAVGIQKLSNQKSSLPPAQLEGLISLFERYHYRFDDPQQPKIVNGKPFYVLELKEKVSSGGYQSLTVFVNPENYFIEKIVGKRGTSKQVELELSSIKTNANLKSGLFFFKVKDGVKVVENPLTIN
jgi:outer membrane lipoprotein carrier protein